jgi:hypothetical protein
VPAKPPRHRKSPKLRKAEAIPLSALESSSIRAAGYDASTQTLRLRYAGGRTYDYLNVPLDVFDDFLAASSKGQFVNWNIKPNYAYRQIA